MDFMNNFMKSVRLPKLNDQTMLYASYAAFLVSLVYIAARGKYSQIALAIGVALVLMATTNDAAVSLLAGALFGLIAAHYYKVESFDDDYEEGDEEVSDEEGSDEEGSDDGISYDEESGDEGEYTDTYDAGIGGISGNAAPVASAYSAGGAINNSSGNTKPAKAKKTKGSKKGKASRSKKPGKGKKGKKGKAEGFVDVEKKEETTEKKLVAKPNPPPDNGERSEFFNLGKKYKLPSETDDKEFHLDAGTTFLNAYKSLKPDQIAAMTKDTQDLMQTQKQLMSTLATLKPLITDGKDMMDMFKSYFGNVDNTTN